jgi:hypothetical protein
MRFLSFCLLSILLIIPQSLFSVNVGGSRIGIDFFLIFVLYAAFSFNFVSGLSAVFILSYALEIFSVLPHGHLMLVASLVFLSLFLFRDHVFAESYLVRSVWVCVFSLMEQLLVLAARGISGSSFLENKLALVIFLAQALLNGALAFPFFIFLDHFFDKIQDLLGRKPQPLTGADLYQVKSGQRKYLS